MHQYGSKYFAYDPGGDEKVKPYRFQKVVMFRIKLKGIEHRAL